MNTDGSRSSVASSTWRAIRDHLEHVAVALGAEAVAVRHLVGERQHVEGRLEVAHRPVQVDRLDRVAADEVDDLERLAQLEQVAEGRRGRRGGARRRGRRRWAGCRPSRRRCGRRRSSACAPGSTSAAGTPTGTCGSARRPSPGRSAPARRRPSAPGRGEQRSRDSGVEEVHPDLGEDPQRRVVDRLQLVGRHDLGRRGSASAAGGTGAARAGGRVDRPSARARRAEPVVDPLRHSRYERTAS